MAIIHEALVLNNEAMVRLTRELAERVQGGVAGNANWELVGIRQGGAVVAEILQRQLQAATGRNFPIGYLDITFYRDDLDTVGPNPVLASTELPGGTDGKSIILVDDVIFSGRTIRAALNALFDYGRPELVKLAVLVDRGDRQLPIQPDHVGACLSEAAGVGESLKFRVGLAGEMSLVRRWSE